MLLTIFTPTYNRAHLLPRLYESLKSQNTNDFEWLIVDDGSTDNTKDLVHTWISRETSFTIRYIYQENSGKHVAHNVGVKNANGEFFYCIDSDDMLAPKTIETISNGFKKLQQMNIDNISGFMAFKSDLNGNLLNKSYAFDDTLLTTPTDFHKKYPHTNDTLALIYFTKVLRKYLFPEIQGSKFITESVIYNRMDRSGYQMMFLKEVLMICEYQSDGYSQNIESLIQKYPTGFKIYWMEKIDMETNYLQLIISILYYHNYSYLSDDTSYSYDGKHKLLVPLLRPLGFIMNVIVTNKYGYKCKVAVKKMLQKMNA